MSQGSPKSATLGPMGLPMGALIAVEERTAFEKRRRKWIAEKEENGRPVEFLMTDCETCGQPWARQRVLRFSEGEFREWEQIANEETRQVRKYAFVTAPLSFFGAIVGGALAGYLLASVTIGVSVSVALFFLYAYFFSQFVRHGRATDGRKRQILQRHGNVPPEKVSMAEFAADYAIIDPSKD